VITAVFVTSSKKY